MINIINLFVILLVIFLAQQKETILHRFFIIPIAIILLVNYMLGEEILAPIKFSSNKLKKYVELITITIVFVVAIWYALS